MVADVGFEVGLERKPALHLVRSVPDYDYAQPTQDWTPIEKLPGYQGKLSPQAHVLRPLIEVPHDQWVTAKSNLAKLDAETEGTMYTSSPLEQRRDRIADYFKTHLGERLLSQGWLDSYNLNCIEAPGEFIAQEKGKKPYSTYAVRLCASCPFTDECLTKSLLDASDLRETSVLTGGAIFPSGLRRINRAILLEAEPKLVRTLIRGERTETRARYGLLKTPSEKQQADA